MARFFSHGLLLAAVCIGGVSNAWAGLFDDDEARRAILELRQRVESHRQADEQAIKQLNEDNLQVRRSLLNLQTQIDNLAAELAKARGQNEQLTKDLAEAQRKNLELQQAQRGQEERLRRFEPIKLMHEGKEITVEPAEKRDFDAAMALFRRPDYVNAQTAFGDFLRRYPRSPYLASVYFWLGNAQYAARDYNGAINNFRALLAHAPEDTRAPEAVLSIANCQLELKDTRAARKTLEDLVKAYPQSEAAAAAKERLTRLR